MSSLPTACVIGAGSSGIAAVKALAHGGYDVTAYEKSDRIGGNWVWGNSNGMSSAYRSLHINTSRERMEYTDFPMPKSYPDFPHHTHIAKYFDDYVDHFGVRDRIRFRDRRRARRPPPRRRLGDRALQRRDAALRRAAGRQRPPLGRALARARVPRLGDFEGVQIHSHDYKGDDPDFFRDKTVVVLGMGNSAMDIAVEASFVADAHLPRRPPRRARDPQVPVRQADRPDRRLDEDPVPGPAAGARGDAQGLPRRHGALRAAEARPSLRLAPTRPSPTTSSRGWRTARSPRSRTSRR